MNELSDKIRDYADSKVKGIISELPLKTHSINDRIILGYVFGGNFGDIYPDSPILKHIIGKSDSTLALRLGDFNGEFLCGRVPYTYGGITRIIHEKPPTDIKDNISTLKEILSDYRLKIPISEDRMIPAPHPDFNPENLARLYDEAKRKILADSIERQFTSYDKIKIPELKDALYYTLTEDLTEGGKYTLYDLTHVYALEFSETEQYKLRSSGGWKFDKGSQIEFAASMDNVAEKVNGGTKRVKELVATHFDCCNKIISGLMRGDYRLEYVARSGSHDRMIYAVKAMFSLRVHKESCKADIVVHDPRNIFIKANR